MYRLISKWLLRFAICVINRLGYHIKRMDHVKRFEAFTFNILEQLNSNSNKIDSITFSKDRAMQLHAFLVSYIEMVNNRGKMYILYKHSNQRHKKSYDELKEIFINENLVFIEENNFRSQLIEILYNSDAGKVIFYVDDIIFTHKIDYSVLEKIDTNKYILALSRGRDMNYSIVLRRPLTTPPFIEIGNNLLQFNWNYFKEFCDWTFPLGVSGYMYGRVEIASVIKAIDFMAPNSLESSMQEFLVYFRQRLGLCPESATSMCVHANIVQNESVNPTLGTFSVDELLNLWENGKRINVRHFYDKPMDITQVLKYTFLEARV